MSERYYERIIEEAGTYDKLAKKLEKRLSPRGSLGIPELLDDRRLQYGIPDGAFKVQASFDRILVHQIAKNDKETYGDTSILMPQVSQVREREEANRGILVSAGLKALDNLRSNGIDIGHIINFIRLSPWRMPVDCIDGTYLYIMILRDGDIIGSEDLADDLLHGKVSVKNVEGEHVLVSQDGSVLGNPNMPWMSEDY